MSHDGVLNLWDDVLLGSTFQPPPDPLDPAFWACPDDDLGTLERLSAFADLKEILGLPRYQVPCDALTHLSGPAPCATDVYGLEETLLERDFIQSPPFAVCQDNSSFENLFLRSSLSQTLGDSSGSRVSASAPLDIKKATLRDPSLVPSRPVVFGPQVQPKNTVQMEAGHPQMIPESSHSRDKENHVAPTTAPARPHATGTSSSIQRSGHEPSTSALSQVSVNGNIHASGTTSTKHEHNSKRPNKKAKINLEDSETRPTPSVDSTRSMCVVDQCRESYAVRKDRDRHMMIEHFGWRFKCPRRGCGTEYTRMVKLRDHIMRHPECLDEARRKDLLSPQGTPITRKFTPPRELWLQMPGIQRLREPPMNDPLYTKLVKARVTCGLPPF